MLFGIGRGVVVRTEKGDGCGPGVALEGLTVVEALAIVSNLSEKSRGEFFSESRE